MTLLDVISLWEGKYINLFKLNLLNRKGNPKDYFIISRRKKKDLICLTKNYDICDGVIVIPITSGNEVVLVKQYRPAINDYIYELPSGMVDKDENFEYAAKRELFEETGLKCKSLKVVLRPSFSSEGICDETTAVVKMDVEGEITNEHIEDSEELEVLKIPISEAKEFVLSHRFSIKGALILLAIDEFVSF